MSALLKRLVTAVVLALIAVALTPLTASAGPPATLLYNQANGQCPSGGALPRVDLMPCEPPNTPSKWQLLPVGSLPGELTIKAAASPGLCITAGTRVGVSPCVTGADSQRWQASPYQTTGTPPAHGMRGLRLRHVATGLCLDNDKLLIGPRFLYLHECNDGEYQQWNVDPAAYLAVFAARHAGMSWALLERRADNLVHVGHDEASNPYAGDTSPTTALPLLCLNRDGRPAPAGIPAGGFHSWAGGEVAPTPPIPGSRLTSRAAADEICSTGFGPGWRMAEFHDGQGWSFWAYGSLPTGLRFWTAIDDQPANPWN
ncbi:hypothetical protein [Kitasatospora sp. NPDC058218]|uniref:RICIN domain-containing protein n=1 Tax=Kitasatospora sp. NPDC058218 TaxID=3346385 RepID=UPI0036DB6AF5